MFTTNHGKGANHVEPLIIACQSPLIRGLWKHFIIHLGLQSRSCRFEGGSRGNTDCTRTRSNSKWNPFVFAEKSTNYRIDYLSSLDEEQQAKITGETQDVEGSGAEPDSQQIIQKFNLPLRTGLTRSKDVTCCSLGHLAGDKGYHCVAKFYAARILLRNQNRAHNRKLGFHGRYSVPNYGTKLMRTFEQCVATRGMVFHKCCNHAAMEKRVKPHFDSLQRKRYEMKMRRIRIPQHIQVDGNLIGI
ncbi:hypothetical protein AVEN_162677-1 [Araneus ventricosus]|uniref:Uncharacterized protein n=2 Tax=Araneus ventricosus TaxID=182803 RepID=A0A4Y2RJZ6_ARAVE|nr:hypothetical protein AVEN_140040-1 [Araneus ventricosus]GBN76127.1 hypothetical protein AVEN_162677-1 [Araneus ventricosus]